MALSNFVTRLLTGILFVAALLGSILFNQYLFLIFFAFVQGLALYEFYGLINQAGKAKVNKALNIFFATILYLSSFLYFSGIFTSLVILFPSVIMMLVLFLFTLYTKESDAIQTLAYSFLGQIYIAIPFSLLHYLAFAYETTGLISYHYILLLALFVLIWVNDSFAYLTGSQFGKHRLFERISPKKTWEGSIGGAIFALLTSLVLAYFYEGLSVLGWIGFALIVVVFGTLGDLIESLLKRTIGVKDSGNMLPGHGGILDRFDSMIFAIPALFAYLLLFKFLI